MANPSPRTFQPASPSLAIITFCLGVSSLFVQVFLNYQWGIVIGLPLTLFTGWVTFRSFVYPREIPGFFLALLGFALTASFFYEASGQLIYQKMWTSTFQFQTPWTTYRDADKGWRIDKPSQWALQEERHPTHDVIGFRPSQATPIIYFSVTNSVAAPQADPAQLVDSYLKSLPAIQFSNIEIDENQPVLWPTGEKAHQLVYTDFSRKIHVREELFFLVHKGRAYILTAGAAPLWFDRNRKHLERMAKSFRLP